MKIEAVFFDMGGVILRTEDQAPRTQLAERLGTTNESLVKDIWFSEESQRATIGLVKEREYWNAVSNRFGMSYEDFLRDFFAGDKLDTVLIDTIRALRTRYKTALLSNAYSDLRLWVEEWKFADAFDTLIVSAEVGLAKPDPAIFRLAAKQVGVAPQASVFIDDVAANIEAAKQVGFHGIQFKNREQALADLNALLETN